MDTKQVVARFEAERQALAMMDHPNIAKVLDAGETQSGRPYFVMELVRGVPITTYCDKNKLTASELLMYLKKAQVNVNVEFLNGLLSTLGFNKPADATRRRLPTQTSTPSTRTKRPMPMR